MKKRAIILGGHGFIGHHMGRRLLSEGYEVVTVDIKMYEYGQHGYGNPDFCSYNKIGDLRDLNFVRLVLDNTFDQVYCFACLMGGAGFIFTGENDAEIMSDSALININVVRVLKEIDFKGRVFYSSSACMYAQEKQNRLIANEDRGLKESDAYPANPDSEYGWEKLFSERLYLAFAKNHGLDVRIARFHNIYGPEGTYKGGKEKAPAAMCRKVIEQLLLSGEHNTSIEVWGDGLQTRSFLYIDDCIDAVRLLMQSDFKEPINIGSEEMISINDLAKMVIDISGKSIEIKNIPGPVGVRGRNSNNDLIRKVLNWEPKYKLYDGMVKTYAWIDSQVRKA